MENFAALLIDVQEKLFPKVFEPDQLEENLAKALTIFGRLNLHLIVTEQYPSGLGSTISSLKNRFLESSIPLVKTAFSCLKEESVKKAILDQNHDHYILMGIETHICVSQTALDLIKLGKKVTVLIDCTSSRSLEHKSVAIDLLRQHGVEITTLEAFIFNYLANSKHPQFKQISSYFKN